MSITTLSVTTNEKPVNITKDNSKSFQHIYIPTFKSTSKYKIGDIVRVAMKKNLFYKGYTQKWTDEIFIIRSVHYTDPTEYELKDLRNEDVNGKFYDYELQKTKDLQVDYREDCKKERQESHSLNLRVMMRTLIYSLITVR